MRLIKSYADVEKYVANYANFLKPDLLYRVLIKNGRKVQCFQGLVGMSTFSTPPTTTTPTNNINTFTLFLGPHTRGERKKYEIHGFKIDFYQ